MLVKLLKICEKESEKLLKFASARSDASGLAIITPQEKESITPYHRESRKQVNYNMTL